jgi:hypothetical protein
MSAIRQMLISTIAIAVIGPVALRGAEIAEYLGGTVKSIPVNATGSLSLGDAKELRFNYGQSVYKLPYGQITGTEIIQGEGRHVLHVRVPRFFGKNKETLAINYKDAAGASGTLNFELSARQASAARDTIAERKAPQAASANQTAQSNEWWGDKYWKTTRNRATWEATTAPPIAPGTPAANGTK